MVVAVGDIFMPRECAACGRKLLLREKHLCIWCQADLPFTFFWQSQRNPMSEKFNWLISQSITNSPNYSTEGILGGVRAAALFFYVDGYKKLSQKLKYNADISEGRLFSRMLGERLSGSELFRDVDLVVPVPLHWTRMLKRGYNQAEVIATELSKCLNARVEPNLLRRIKHTKTQTKLSIEQKADNVAGAFDVCTKILEKNFRSNSMSPHHILIVDDVFTTGSTLLGCWLPLRKALSSFSGTCLVSVATLAFVGNS